MRFLVDAQLPPALARWLTARGYEAAHVSEKGMQAAADRLIWDCALIEGWVIVTKDEDFAPRLWSGSGGLTRDATSFSSGSKRFYPRSPPRLCAAKH